MSMFDDYMILALLPEGVKIWSLLAYQLFQFPDPSRVEIYKSKGMQVYRMTLSVKGSW